MPPWRPRSCGPRCGRSSPRRGTRTLPLVEWRRRLADAGWAAPSWPARWGGRGLPAWADDVVGDELVRGRRRRPPVGSGMLLAAPTILAHGPDDVRDRFLLPTLTGEQTWCQLFSEPGAGSDLAGLTTRAELDGDEWVVNGQKVWTTSAHHADLGMLVARTDWDVPKHAGLTYFVLPMHQPGVEVRPLRQMNEHSSFNEVFLTDARVPGGRRGGRGRRRLEGGAHDAGLRAALRRCSAGRPTPTAPAGPSTRPGPRPSAHFATYRWYPQRAGRVDLVVERARAAGVADDPVVRQEIAALLSLDKAAAVDDGSGPGPRWRSGAPRARGVDRQAGRQPRRPAGPPPCTPASPAPTRMLTGPDSAAGGVIAEVLVSVPAQSIAGGTDEIQRNILGERALGLPREPSADKDRPFREVPRNG